MRRHALLQALHEKLQPRTYLEIGVSSGTSMSISRTRSIGVDPFFLVRREQQCDLQLVREASDEFFAREDPLAHFAGTPVDLAFIDGMHLSEYTLRDFVNVERFTHPGSVVVLDDMLPRHRDEAGRDRALGRQRGAWTGDVFKVVASLRDLRPDLVCLALDTAPTGTVVVFGLDAASRVLLHAYDDLVEAYVTPDPQDVPPEILHRTRAHDPARLLEMSIWEDLRCVRGLPSGRAQAEAAKAIAAVRRVA